MKRRQEAGQALYITAAALVVLMGFMGLGIDMGVMRYEKRLQQTAVDAAAIAGANNLGHGGVTSGAQDASATNGFTDNGGGQVSNCGSGAAIGTVCVQVNSIESTGGPQSGPHTGDADYVEVLVAAVHPTYFMRVLGINQETITARAVATNVGGGPGSGCLYTLGPPTSSIEGVNINGSATLNAPNCGIIDNGNFNTRGNALTVTAATFGASGWNSSGPGGTVTCTEMPGPCPQTDPPMPAAGDPLQGLTSPCSFTSCTGGGAISISGSGGGSCGSGCFYDSSTGVYTISPGTYSSISIQGTGGNTNGCVTTGSGVPSVVFQPGLYVIDSGNLSVQGNAMISGSGVTFYFTNTATVSMTGTPDVQLSAGASQYPGILFYQDPNDTNTGPAPNGPTLGGDNCSNYKGALYFPSDQLTFYGNNNNFDVGIVIVKSLALSGNPMVNILGTADMPAGVDLITNAVLVE
jgi:hypothetical protein